MNSYAYFGSRVFLALTLAFLIFGIYIMMVPANLENSRASSPDSLAPCRGGEGGEGGGTFVIHNITIMYNPKSYNYQGYLSLGKESEDGEGSEMDCSFFLPDSERLTYNETAEYIRVHYQIGASINISRSNFKEYLLLIGSIFGAVICALISAILYIKHRISTEKPAFTRCQSYHSINVQ